MSFDDELRAALDDDGPAVDLDAAWTDHRRRIGSPAKARRPWLRPMVAAASVVVVGASAVTVALAVRSADPVPAPAAPPPSAQASAPSSSVVPSTSAAPVTRVPSDAPIFPLSAETACDGVEPGAPGLRLGPDIEVTSAEACVLGSEVVDGDGIWETQMVLAVPDDRLPALLGALRAPDAVMPPSMGCTAVAFVSPAFVLTLADGTRMRPEIPTDACDQPSAIARQALDDAEIVVSSVRLRRVVPQVVVDTGCDFTTSSPTVSAPAFDQVWPTVPAGVVLSVCRYGVGTMDRAAELVSTGTMSSDDLAALWPGESGAAPSGCGIVDEGPDGPRSLVDTYGSTGADWIQLTVSPTEPYRPDQATSDTWSVQIDLGSCGWVTSRYQAVGHVPPAFAADLAAHADRPVLLDERTLPGPESADDPLLTCGGDPFRASAMTEPWMHGQNLDEIAAALDDLNSRMGSNSPLEGVPATEAEWFVLSADHSDGSLQVAVGEWNATVGPVGPESLVVELERSAEGLTAKSWGSCLLTPVPPDGVVWARIWTVESNPDSSVVEMDVTELSCVGRDPERWYQEPVVEENEDAVVIRFTTTTIRDEVTNCPDDAVVRRTVELSAPLGDRLVLDGSFWPAAPAAAGP